MKAVLVRQYLDEQPSLQGKSETLPPPVARLIADPPPVSEWIPEAQGIAFFLAGADLLGLDETAFCDFVYRMNVKLLRGPLYRVMMMMVSPAVIIRFAESRWGTFHRGIKLRAEMRPDGVSAGVGLVYPTHLMPELMARAYCGAFRAAIEASGGKDVRFGMSTYGSTAAQFDGHWA
jgi:hypothetical protein